MCDLQVNLKVSVTGVALSWAPRSVRDRRINLPKLASQNVE